MRMAVAVDRSDVGADLAVGVTMVRGCEGGRRLGGGAACAVVVRRTRGSECILF